MIELNGWQGKRIEGIKDNYWIVFDDPGHLATGSKGIILRIENDFEGCAVYFYYDQSEFEAAVRNLDKNEDDD